MHRFAWTAAGAFVLLFGVAAFARAQDSLGGAERPLSARVEQPTSVAPASNILTSLPAAVADISVPAPQSPAIGAAGAERRPKALVPLYVSLGSLQAMDIHSTTRALGRGAVEANPLLKSVVGHPLALAAVKIGGSVALVYAAEKMWKKKKRKAAVIYMLAMNAGLAFVVQHNYRAIR
jgi:hypothetical protein